jgi:hypothetical protein
VVINWEFGFFLEIRFLVLIWRLIFYKQSSLGQLRIEVSPRSRIFASLRRQCCNVKGSSDFLSSALGVIRGCFYQLPSLGSFTYAPPRIAPIVLTRPGVYSARSRDPHRGSRSASKKACVRQGSSDTDHSLEVFKKNKHLHVNWLLELWSLRNVARWFQILLNMSIWYSRYRSHRPVMILILPNISSIFVDVWVIGYLRNWFVDFVIGFWSVNLLISSLDSEVLV